MVQMDFIIPNDIHQLLEYYKGWHTLDVLKVYPKSIFPYVWQNLASSEVPGRFWPVCGCHCSTEVNHLSSVERECWKTSRSAVLAADQCILTAAGGIPSSTIYGQLSTYDV